MTTQKIPQKKPLALTVEGKATRLVFKTSKTAPFFYEWVFDREAFPSPLSMEGARVSDIDTEASVSTDDPWFIFYVADCAWPSYHAIQSQSWEDAYEQFIDQEAERGHYVLKREEYDSDEEFEKACEEAPCSSDGKPMNTEPFQGFEVSLTLVEFD